MGCLIITADLIKLEVTMPSKWFYIADLLIYRHTERKKWIRHLVIQSRACLILWLKKILYIKNIFVCVILIQLCRVSIIFSNSMEINLLLYFRILVRRCYIFIIINKIKIKYEVRGKALTIIFRGIWV